MKQALRFLPDIVNLFMIEAGLAHLDFIVVFAGNLLVEVELGDVPGSAMGRREVIQVLETVLMRLMSGKSGSSLLQVEVYEAFRARLDHSLVVRAHGAEIERIEAVLVSSFALLLRHHIC
mmetsp:Transcript_37146/g.48850  ORF Transcript_37146/g.48850 Transcript_37146/m.48850 type:complete len:120 (-) Transcript_37146:361-720(-)|eukprot:CAMPEP_0185581338 /NCGR_PEP_ID=MMETSP0434-20130131/18251_1 /TAXON_ID=626734 ORGANISM="Favella taraikaensis, Strain Fe Narragansett Bay" /NCGR_SAMPLE_ID=MMETSP0434 /ASSEMBLY_ACC=CAM_ASM_000379 /LENGTH=119 /DNA_ID=CAMNT_0028199851 /DNA_START=525 /DNA_END=884 /DNA_ORIENTATION=-